jgi:hypothetical protein
VRPALLQHAYHRRRTEFAAEQKISEERALKIGLEQKAKEFVKNGTEVYTKA